MGKVALIAVLLLLPSIVMAKNKPPKWATRDYLELSWASAMPVAQTYRDTGRISFIGARAGYRFRIVDRVSVGARAAWNLFEDEYPDAVTIDGIRLNGVRKTQNRFLFLGATTHVYFPDGDKRTLLPFLGLGLGAYRTNRNSRISGVEDTTARWRFGMHPEAGLIALLKRLPLLFSVSFHAAMPTAVTRKVETFTSFNIGVGIPN